MADSYESARETLLAALPGHTAEDAVTVDYLLLVLRDAGYVITHLDSAPSGAE